MTQALAAYESLTEAGIKSALIEARGDLFIASQLLGITVLRLDRALQIAPALQTVYHQALETASNPDYERATSAQFESAVKKRLSAYRVVGLDALHDLAAMPIDENSAQNQVKLAAAARLAGSVEAGGFDGELAEALRELNMDYHQHSQRIRVVRETKTAIEITPHEREVDSQ